MTEELIEIVEDRGNVFRDLGYLDANLRQARALMGAKIIKIIDPEGLSTRQAEARTGYCAVSLPHPLCHVQPVHFEPAPVHFVENRLPA